MIFPKPYADLVQRFRVPAGFILLAAFLALSRPDPASLATGIPVSLAGLAIRAWAAGHLDKNQSLTLTGPYALIRNPLYLGTLIAASGLAIASRSAAVGILTAAIFILVYLPVIEQEERHLHNLFPGFSAYTRAVPLLIPFRFPYASLAGFRPSLYLRNQEYKAFLAFLAGIAYLAWRAGLLG